MSKPPIVLFESYEQWDHEPMSEQYTLHAFPSSGNPLELDASVREQVSVIAFKGHSVLGPDIIDAFPKLRLIANYGVGYDTIDVAHASSKGIKVTNTPDVLTNDVADLAVGMLLALSRDIVGASQWVIDGSWAKQGAYPLQRTLTGTSIGIAGLGRIGRAVAQRLSSFDTHIHYYSRSEKQTPGWVYHNSLIELAKTVDILMVCLSGGSDTTGIISAEVIRALGKDALLVNCSRGSTVDEEALIKSLENGQLRGMASDVFNNEPGIDPRFLKLKNVLLQPHQSSGTVETRQKMGRLQRENMAAFFANKPLVTPIN